MHVKRICMHACMRSQHSFRLLCMCLCACTVANAVTRACCAPWAVGKCACMQPSTLWFHPFALLKGQFSDVSVECSVCGGNLHACGRSLVGFLVPSPWVLRGAVPERCQAGRQCPDC